MVTANSLTINTLLISNPGLARVFDDSKNKNDTEVSQAWLITTIFDYYESVFFQYEKETLSPELWTSSKLILKEVLKNKKFREKWEDVKGQYYENFRNVVENEVLK